MVVRNPQVMIAYTGGICGPFILFLIPITLVWYGRRKLGDMNDNNINASPYKSKVLMIIMIIFAFATLFMALYGAVTGESGE